MVHSIHYMVGSNHAPFPMKQIFSGWRWRFPCCAWDNWFFPDGKKEHATESLLHLLLILCGFLLCLPTKNYKSKSWCYAFTTNLRREKMLTIPAVSSNTCKEEINWLHSYSVVRYMCDGKNLLLVKTDSVIKWCNLAAICSRLGGSGCMSGEAFACQKGSATLANIAQRSCETPFLSFQDSARQS